MRMSGLRTDSNTSSAQTNSVTSSAIYGDDNEVRRTLFLGREKHSLHHATEYHDARNINDVLHASSSASRKHQHIESTLDSWFKTYSDSETAKAHTEMYLSPDQEADVLKRAALNVVPDAVLHRKDFWDELTYEINPVAFSLLHGQEGTGRSKTWRPHFKEAEQAKTEVFGQHVSVDQSMPSYTLQPVLAALGAARRQRPQLHLSHKAISEKTMMQRGHHVHIMSPGYGVWNATVHHDRIALEGHKPVDVVEVQACCALGHKDFSGRLLKDVLRTSRRHDSHRREENHAQRQAHQRDVKSRAAANFGLDHLKRHLQRLKEAEDKRAVDGVLQRLLEFDPAGIKIPGGKAALVGLLIRSVKGKHTCARRVLLETKPVPPIWLSVLHKFGLLDLIADAKGKMQEDT